MSLKILLIDSDDERARSLTDALAAAGFAEVLRAAAGADLVETVKRLAPDLVVVDMALPDRDALEGVRALSANAPRPIVMFADKDDPAFVAVPGRRRLHDRRVHRRLDVAMVRPVRYRSDAS